jgi:hypothetical protein
MWSLLLLAYLQRLNLIQFGSVEVPIAKAHLAAFFQRSTN